MKVKKLLLLGALALPSTVFANEGAHVDGYYIPYSKITFDDDANDIKTSLDGNGYGAKAMIPLGPTQNFFVTGEYQSSSIDHDYTNGKIKDDVDQFRAGAGWQVPLASGSGALYAEYINLKQDQNFANQSLDAPDNDGYGIHVRLAFPIARQVNLYGQIGYVSLSSDQNTDSDGAEFLVGGSVDVSRNIGAFIDYRQSNLKTNYHDGLSDEKDTLKDLRVGIRILFDTAGGWY